MSNHWHYKHGGEQRGPVSPAELKRLASSGELSPDDKVWREGMEKWVLARTIKGLFAEQSAAVQADQPPLPPKAARPASRQPVTANRDDEVDETQEKPAKGGGLLLFGILGGSILAVLLLGVAGAVAFWPKGKSESKADQAAVKPDLEPTISEKRDDKQPDAGKTADKGGPPDLPTKESNETELPTLPVKEGPPIVVSAGRLAKDFQYHEADAEEKYKGAVVRVTGLHVNPFIVDGDKRRVTLRSGGQVLVECYLSKGTMESDKGKLLVDQTLCLEGQCVAVIKKRADSPSMTRPWHLALKDCKVLLVKPRTGAVTKSTPQGLPAEPKEVQARQMCLEYGDDQTAADLKYNGKSFTLSGVVWEVMESDGEVFLEAGTDLRKVRCLFGSELQERLTALVKAGTLKAGMPLTVRGTCSGSKGSDVRMDNCEIVPPKVVAFYQLADRAEVVTARQLASEYQADEVKADRKYRERLVEVTGVIREADGEVVQHWAEVNIEGGTDTRLSVGCVFAARESLGLKPLIGGRLKAGQTVTIRGICSGVERSLKRVRLDNCELVGPGDSKKSTPTTESKEAATDDFFPHRPDATLTYDAAVVGKSVTVIRSQHAHKADGVIETTVVKTGQLTGRDLATGTIRWGKDVNQKAKHPLHHRIKGGFVEIGQHLKSDAEVSWEPVLKVGAKAGDEWSWDVPGGGTKKYTLMKFDKHKGRSAVLVRAVLDSGESQLVSEHIYAKGVGEVERVTFLVQKSASAVVGQIRLVEDK